MYFCSQCGTPCEEGDRFCSGCGAAVKPRQPAGLRQGPASQHDTTTYVQSHSVDYEKYSDVSAQRPSVGMGVASLVLGLISMIGCWVFFLSIPFAILAIVLGGVQNSKRFSSGMATAGIVLGIISLVFGIVCFFGILVSGSF